MPIIPKARPFGWGLSPWGLSEWGLGGGAAPTITLAYALSERSLRLTLSEEPAHQTPANTGDALDPKTWRVKRLDTQQELLVLAVNEVDIFTYDLYLLNKFGGYLITHEVSTPNLLSATGIQVDPGTKAEFLGCAVVQFARSPVAELDIKNFSRSETDIAGTLDVGSDGDYEVHGGVDYLRKLVIRRLTTAPTEFFFLDPRYGIGFKIKEPLPNLNLVELRNEIEQQLRQEPEFSRVQIRLVLTPDNVLSIEVRAVLRRTNDQVVIPVQAQGVIVL